MKFSIIIPIYKVEKYLEHCIDSVLAQTYHNFEVILIDDGSPDKCPQICDQYALKDSRIQVIHQPNGGQSSARNIGIELAKGDYIIFIDSDDWWFNSECLSKINKKLLEKDCEVLLIGMKKYYTLSNRFGNEQLPILEDEQNITIERLMQNNLFRACAWDKVIKRSIIEKYNLRFVVGQTSEDIEWCAKLLLIEPKFNILSEYIYIYRQQNTNSITANIKRKNIEDVINIIERFSNNNPTLPLKHYLANQLILLMGFSRKVETKSIKDLLERAKKYWWLTKYNWYPYVRIVSKIRFLGFNNTKYLLNVYHKYKRG